MNSDIGLLASRAGLVVLEPSDIADLPADERVVYLARLRAFCLDHDMRDYGPYVEWIKFADRCAHTDETTGEQCTRTRYADNRTCLSHLDINEIDPMLVVREKSERARIRMAEMLDVGVDRLEEIITADPDAVSPNVRLNAISTLFDRAGLPKQTATSLDARVEVTDTSHYRDVITERLERLASATVTRELDGIAEITDAEVVEDDDESDHA